MLVWSNYIQKVPIFGKIYTNNYFILKRSYINFLRKSGIQPGPLVVHWLATYRCNSNCVYCEASANEPKCKELKTEQMKKVINELGELKVRRFFVTGGEPLMREDLFEILDHAKRHGMSLGMITNSLLYAKFKKQIKNAAFQSIWTSVDGLASTHDKNRGHRNAYRITFDAIKYYADINIPLRVVNTVVHPRNYDELPKLFEELKNAEINRWRLVFVTPIGRGGQDNWALNSEQIRNVFQYVGKERRNFEIELSEELGYLGCWDTRTRNSPFFCPSGLTFCAIMPDGNVLPCQVVYDAKYSEGNIKETSFQEIWKNGFKKFRKVMFEGECVSCLHKKACGGGCWGRMVTEGNCLRRIWDEENYGNEN